MELRNTYDQIVIRRRKIRLAEWRKYYDRKTREEKLQVEEVNMQNEEFQKQLGITLKETLNIERTLTTTLQNLEWLHMASSCRWTEKTAGTTSGRKVICV